MLILLYVISMIVLLRLINIWLKNEKIIDYVLDLPYPFYIVFSCRKCMFFWSSLFLTTGFTLLMECSIKSIVYMFFIFIISNIYTIKNNK